MIDNITHLRAVKEYLFNNVATEFMMSTALKLDRGSSSWYLKALRESGNLVKVKKANCKVSGRKAWYLSTNPVYKITNQLELFEGGGYD